MIKPDKQQVFSISNEQQFADITLQVFHYQAQNCTIYREFITNLKVDVDAVRRIDQIPFLPISFFKSHEVLSTTDKVQVTFTSSGTTGMINSRHRVTFALLDFVEQHAINFPELIVMETGGMKGRRKEMIREELHEVLCNGFGVDTIHSEYGMTELLSQAYSKGNGIFNCPPWMKVITRDTNDPVSTLDSNKTGGINVIDLANINSCSFIATQDLGKVYKDGSFEVLGRFDNSDIRGCNLLIA
jgi:hypothetical protein